MIPQDYKLQLISRNDTGEAVSLRLSQHAVSGDFLWCVSVLQGIGESCLVVQTKVNRLLDSSSL